MSPVQQGVSTFKTGASSSLFFPMQFQQQLPPGSPDVWKAQKKDLREQIVPRVKPWPMMKRGTGSGRTAESWSYRVAACADVSFVLGFLLAGFFSLPAMMVKFAMVVSRLATMAA
jgi:hypothetical protein